MTTWRDRINDTISLKSPSGRQFNAYWTGNKRSKEKKVGIFDYPKARGVLTQDLDSAGTKYPLNIYFEGPDHDISAQQFWNACDERGPWEVLHPTKGNLTLQLLSVTEMIDPVTYGNITEFDTDWIETGINNPAASVAEIESDVYEQLTQVQATASNQFTDKVETDTALIAAVKKVVAVVDKLKTGVAGVMAVATAQRATVLGIVNSNVVLVNSLFSAVFTLILTPGQSANDLKTRINYYEDVFETTFNDFAADFETVYVDGVTGALTVELVAIASITGMAETLLTADFNSRDEALHYLERLDAAAMQVINGLDGIQAAYATQFIDQQYFSQSDSFNDLMELLRRVRELLLRRSFDLATAKTITLRTNRAPIEIAITEGVDLDAFIAANELHGDDILLLPAGRQVVVYK